MPVTKRYRTKCGRRTSCYQAEIYVRGVRLACETFDTASAAHVWHDDTKRKLEAGQTDPSSVKTFGEVVAEYKATAFQELRRSSQQARASRFPYFEASPMTGILMRDFETKVVDDWLRWLKAQATTANRNRKSFQQELKLLSVVLNWYKNEQDHRFAVPIVRRHHRAAFFRPIAVRQQDYYMRPEEVVRWLQALRGRPDPVYYRLALLMVLTGLRMGEAAGLCWDAIEHLDDHSARVRVVRTLSWDYSTKEAYFQEEAKTEGAVRTVPIEGAVLQMLQTLKREQTTASGVVPVFQTLRSRLLRDNTIRDNFNTAFAECSLSWSGTHIARHTFATLALISEKDIATVQAALGHTSHKMTERYAKVIALQSSQVSRNVADLIGLPQSQREPVAITAKITATL